MAAVNEGLFPVMEKFPDRKDEFNRLFRDSEAFQALCEDYLICAEALCFWSHFESEEAPDRRKEYAGLLEELEMEIRRYLKQLS